jgi:hypothetical protein
MKRRTRRSGYGLYVAVDQVTFWILKMGNRARGWTKYKFSRCGEFRNVASVIKMGVTAAKKRKNLVLRPSMQETSPPNHSTDTL